MREKINRLAKGIVDNDQIDIMVYPASFEEKIPLGRKVTGELNIQDRNGGFVKGLAYSSDFRVRMIHEVFGGTRSRVSFEVDSHHLLPGDRIQGELLLVTNGGEIHIPYHFTVSRGQSGELLDSLKTPEDFTAVVRKEPETALQLIGYEDFAEAPFMQDAHIHTLFEAFKGRADRRNSLEEFLVALGQKEPVRLQTDTRTRCYNAPKSMAKDEIRISFSNWGYASFRVSTDGAFLSLPKNVYTSDDASEGVCTVTYLVDPSCLHAGHNLGSIRIETIRETFTIPIEVRVIDLTEENPASAAREDISRYTALRLKCEFTEQPDRLLLGQIEQEVKNLGSRYGDTLLLAVCQADLHILKGEKEQAALILDSRRGEMAELRQEEYICYCFYIYLQLQLQKRENQKETLIRLVRKYMQEEDPSGALFYLWTKLDPALYDKPEFLLDEIHKYYEKGCRSPYLYAAALKLYWMHPEFLQSMENFELQVMLFGIRKHLLAEDVALYAARIASERRHYHKLTCRMLILMYEEFGKASFLECVCGMLIKGHCRDRRYFHWYEEALQKGVSLTGLYEYYLYTLPLDYGFLLPKEVLMYFSYGTRLDDASRAKLYRNIVQFMPTDSSLYQQFERDIEQFTMAQLMKGRVDRRLVVLYQHMIYPEIIDTKAAKIIPSILRTYRIRIENPNIRYVIVCYEELKDEDAYPVKDGVAYVPLYLENPVILFQDQFGNRYYNISSRKVLAMDQESNQELLERCYEEYPEHPMLCLKNAGEIARRGINGEDDVVVLQRAAEDMKLRAFFRRMILTEMIAYHMKLVRNPERGRKSDAGYLLGIDPDKLTREERCGISEALTSQNYYYEVWARVREYGMEGLSDGCLLKLCSWKILKDLSGEDAFVTALAWRLFAAGHSDSVLLDYLSEYYNGTGEDMFRLMQQGQRDHIELYDLAERLMAQLLFTGDDRYLDQVFECYAAGRTTGESLMKAYFTRKSAAYFMDGKKTGDKVFAYLEGVVQSAQEMQRVPTIYLLALSRYYSDLEEMDEERKTLCEKMLEELLEEGRIFSWFKKLGRFVSLPDTLADKTILEYRSGHGASAPKPRMMIRILPMEYEFHPEEMKRVYADIYVNQKVLFAGETMEYQIYDIEDGTEVLKIEGKQEPQTEGMPSAGRFAELNEICQNVTDLREEMLKEKMKKYMTDLEKVETLFTLM